MLRRTFPSKHVMSFKTTMESGQTYCAKVLKQLSWNANFLISLSSIVFCISSQLMFWNEVLSEIRDRARVLLVGRRIYIQFAAVSDSGGVRRGPSLNSISAANFNDDLTAQHIYSTQKEKGSSGSYHGHPIVTTLRHITCPSLLFTNYKNHLMQVLTNIRAWNTAWAPCCHRVCLNRRGTTTGWLRGTPAAPLCPRRR